MKKTIAMLLASLLCVSLFVACGDEPTPTDPALETQQTEPATEEVTETVTEPETEETTEPAIEEVTEPTTEEVTEEATEYDDSNELPMN